MNSAVKRSSVPAPRKDLTRVKRRRTRPPSPIPQLYPDINTMDIDQLLATLTEETGLLDVSDCMKDASVFPTTRVNYCAYNPSSTFASQQAEGGGGGGGEDQQVETDMYQPKHLVPSSLPPPPPPPPPPTPSPASKSINQSTQSCNTAAAAAAEPRLLLRQIYKVANQADAVVGLDALKDFKPSIYVTNNIATITFTFEDLLSLQSASVTCAINKFFSERTLFKPFYLHTVLVEARPNGIIAMCNYQFKQKQVNQNLNSVMLSKPNNESDIERQTPRLLLQKVGWTSLKKLFSTLESYFNILVEISPAVQFLITRYSRYFTKHYKVMALFSTNTTTDLVAMTLDKQLIRHITNDLPRLLQELNERRLPTEQMDHWYEHTALRTSMLPWIDSEVRRFCASNITDSVLDNLKYVARW